MSSNLGRTWFLCVAIWITVCCADDMVMQLFANRPINYVSDKFISYSMSPADMVEIYQNKRNLLSSKLQELGPAHLKISLDSDARNHITETSASKTDLGEWLYDSTKSHGVKLIVPLPYDPRKWNPREVIGLLNKFTKMDMNDAIWQLGSDFHATDAMKYIDDLSTLRTIVDAFATMNKNQSWTVVGSDLTVGSNENEARLYSELSEHIVSAVGWSQSPESLFPEEHMENIFAPFNIDPALRTILNSRMPVWLTLTHTNPASSTSDSTCYMPCMMKGLKWAQTLGDAARNGFKMIYTPIDQHEWFKPSLTYYTTLLHKRLMGETVLDTKMMNGNRLDAHVYSHCTRNSTGAFTIYGVNSADTRARVLAKMPPMRAGNEFAEYVLTVNSANGKVQLNGNDIGEGMPLNAVIKAKRFNKPAFLSLPAYSVGFWVFTRANLPECERSHDVHQTTYERMGKTSSEQLLQELIRDEIERDDEMEKNSIDKSKVTKRDRRDVHNVIKREHKSNAIPKNVNVGVNEIHKRDRRSIDDDFSAARHRRAGNLMNLIYSEVDSMKRRIIHSPLAAKVGAALAPKRSKRHINALNRLLEKFEFRKPTFNLKTPSFKLGTAAIPPITAVHDIYAMNSAEGKIFQSAENPDLPTGDIQFQFEEHQIHGQNPTNAAYGVVDSAAMNSEAQVAAVNGPISMPSAPVDVLNDQANQDMYYEALFGDAPLQQTPPPPQSFNAPPMPVANEPQPPRYDELWEIDAAQFRPMPSLAPKQPAQPQEPVVNQNIDFVVKELQPTWQKNQENLQKARNTLQKFYPPSLGGSKISSLLPNVARPQNIRSPFFDSAERRFFETRRRRRRSIDSKMNDDIEKRLQQVTAAQRQQNDDQKQSGEYSDLDEAIEKLTVLERALKIVTDIDRKQNPTQKNDFARFTADLEKLGDIVAQSISSKSTQPKKTDDNLQKRCKVLSKSLEQRCLHEPSTPFTALFKREMNEDKTKKPIGPLKKLLANVKGAQREKRSIDDVLDRLSVNDIQMNEISRNLFGEAKTIDIPIVKRPYVPRDERPITRKVYDEKSEEYVPKVLRIVKSTVNRLLDTVTSHVNGWWQSLL